MKNISGAKRLINLWIFMVVLALGLGMTIAMKIVQGEITLHQNLLSKLPTAFSGWSVMDMPVATSAEMQKAVSEMLNYDEAVFREYSKDGRSFTVYAAYWRPFRFHPRLISIHTPDVCWVGNGWEMKDADYNYAVTLRNGAAWHAQERFFQAGSVGMNVIYWHIIDGKLSGYAEGPNSTNRSFMHAFLYDLRHGAGEQFFIRFSSAQPWSVWKDDPMFLEVLNTFLPVLKATE
jgi:hypothetical protein